MRRQYQCTQRTRLTQSLLIGGLYLPPRWNLVNMQCRLEEWKPGSTCIGYRQRQNKDPLVLYAFLGIQIPTSRPANFSQEIRIKVIEDKLCLAPRLGLRAMIFDYIEDAGTASTDTFRICNKIYYDTPCVKCGGLGDHEWRPVLITIRIIDTLPYGRSKH